MVADATLDHLERDEAHDIGAELDEILSRRAGAVLLQRTIDCGPDAVQSAANLPTGDSKRRKF